MRQRRIGAVITNRVIAIFEAQRLDAVKGIGIAGAVGHRQGADLDRHRVIGKAAAEHRDIATAVTIDDVAAFAADQNILVVPAG